MREKRGELRRKVVERDRCCRGCGKPGAEVHHIIYRSQGGKDKMGNLIFLCSDCHARAHFRVKDDPIWAWELFTLLESQLPTLTMLRRGWDLGLPYGQLCVSCDIRDANMYCEAEDAVVERGYTCELWTLRRGR